MKRSFKRAAAETFENLKGGAALFKRCASYAVVGLAGLGAVIVLSNAIFGIPPIKPVVDLRHLWADQSSIEATLLADPSIRAGLENPKKTLQEATSWFRGDVESNRALMAFCERLDALRELSGGKFRYDLHYGIEEKKYDGNSTVTTHRKGNAVTIITNLGGEGDTWNPVILFYTLPSSSVKEGSVELGGYSDDLKRAIPMSGGHASAGKVTSDKAMELLAALAALEEKIPEEVLYSKKDGPSTPTAKSTATATAAVAAEP